ncbi:multicopper oxidase-domain-containing protein [Kalaharituber pfeilii]|nr:multicopper oxidase-domain-containing protein [Kalaharituber pfeilii]
MLGDFPALFQSQQQSHEVQLSIVDHSTTLSRPHKYKCPKPNSDFTPFLVNSCNSPSNRQKWCYGYDINTDFEEVVPNTGVTRKFTLVLTNANYCGDGYAVDGTLINGSYPGPMLEGNWGDWFEITVINELTNCNGTAIHWHGVRQWKTVWEDGVGGVTQCPIPTYRWRATQYGASWYHRIVSADANGALGPLLIHGPATANYDIDKGPLLITDWYHRDAFEVYHNEVVPGGNATVLFQPPAKLMNGVGRFVQGNQYNNDSFPACEVGKGRCIDHGSIYKTEVVKGKRHRFRIMNTSTSLHFTFWIEGHTMTVIGADFVPIKPYTAKVLNVAIGE